MKKLTKKSLKELAKVMPVLSEMEMREYVGGDIIYLNEDGTFSGSVTSALNQVYIKGQSSPIEIPAGISFRQYSYEYQERGESGFMEDKIGNGLLFDFNDSGTFEEQKYFFEQVASRTTSEWGWAHNNPDGDKNQNTNGVIFTGGRDNAIDPNIMLEYGDKYGYNTFYHSHPEGSEYGQSWKDENLKDQLEDRGYENVGFYDVDQRRYENGY